MPQTKSKSGTSTSRSAHIKSKTSASSATRRQQSSDGELEKYFYESLKDIYWAEKHLTKAIPKMMKAACNQELVTALEDHLDATGEHVERLEKVFELLGKKAQAKKCEAMEGLTKEAESIIEETEEGTSTRDVGIIMAAQKVEHYEIATYGGLAQLAKTMGLGEVKELLGQTLQEEKEADQTLTTIAETDINMQAEEEEE
jgi:ferritin-like metal-binding protein YciE